MYSLVGITFVARQLQARMQALGITPAKLNEWAEQHGFRPFEYPKVWGACSGRRASQDRFLIRLSQCMGLDPRHVLLTACADRVPTSYQDFFLAMGDGLARYLEVVENWQALDVATQQTILHLIRDPEQTRRWVQQNRMVTQAELR